MTTRVLLPAFCATLAAAMCCTATSSAARIERPRLTLADRNVTVAGQPAAAGVTVAAGDTIVTGSRARAELTLPDGTVVRIGQGSRFTYTGSKLVLDQGSALFRLARKNATVVTPSRTYTGGPAVVSAQAAKGYEGLFVLQGAGKVNGIPLIAGETSVLERGKDRKFTFDLRKMVGTSALVTKFPQTPWMAETGALASLQHQLLTGKVVQAAKSDGRGQQGAGANPVSALVSNQAARLVSTGGAGVLLAGSARDALGGTLQVSGGALSLGGGGTLRFSGGTLNLATSSLGVSGATIQGANLQVSALNSLTKTGAGTLVLNSHTTLAGNTATTTAANGSGNTGGVLIINPPTSGTLTAGNTGTLNIGGQTLNPQTGGVLTTGASSTISGTLTNSGTLQLGNGGTLPALQTGGGILTIQPGTTIGGLPANLQAGQTVTIGGVNYTASSGAGGTLLVQPVAQ